MTNYIMTENDPDAAGGVQLRSAFQRIGTTVTDTPKGPTTCTSIRRSEGKGSCNVPV
jgi:hypothetical protein